MFDDDDDDRKFDLNWGVVDVGAPTADIVDDEDETDEDDEDEDIVAAIYWFNGGTGNTPAIYISYNPIKSQHNNSK